MADQQNDREMMEDILKILDMFDYIKPEEIPGIDLYMDQVTTFMESRLRKAARYPDGDKIMTKTMINNYAKNDLLPPPDKKKYSREHILLLIFIYYYKSFLSINDIQTLLAPITEKFFKNGKEFGLEEIYREVFGLEKDTMESLREDVKEKYAKAEEAFEEAPDDQKDFLKNFAFICELSFDVYLKKMIIEKMLDEFKKESIRLQEEKETKKKGKEAKDNKDSKTAKEHNGTKEEEEKG